MTSPVLDGKSKPPLPCLALRPREAAKAIGVSERTLWDWTKRGIVPHMRMGKTILYPVDALQRWLETQVATTRAEGDHE